jgi:uncharacterized protein YndB with AHSA1/START domain
MSRTVVHDTFVIERHYPASPKRVFGAFADPAAKRQWFGDDPGIDTTSYLMEFEIGGRESLTAQARDGGSVYTYDAVYRDIVEDERIVHSYEMTVGRRMSVSVATFEFLPQRDGTLLILTEQGAYLDGLDTSAAREQGTREFLDALGHYLEQETR